MMLEENVVIKPGVGECPIEGPHRVLLIDEELELASIIALPGFPLRKGKRRKYATGPKLVPLRELEQAIQNHALVITDFHIPGHWSMTDEDFLAEARTEKELEQRKSRIAAKNAAWEIVQGVVQDLSLRQIARDPQRLRSRIIKQSERHAVNVSTVYSLVNKYLASGGVRSSLLPDFHLRGAPGKQKVQKTKLGRKSRLEKAAGDVPEKFVLSKDAKDRLAIGYLTFRHGRTEREAFLLTSGVFWSHLDADGKSVLLPPEQRPTQAQFRYWGLKLNDIETRRRRIGADAWRSKVATGSTQDQVVSVGQMAMIDSTSSDVYLTSMWSRLKKLPPMHQTIVKEQRSTAVIGFYVGWESPSSSTALQAVLSSAESKVEICARFGIPMRDEDWPGILCRHYIADNGEMKAKVVTDAEKEFRFAVEYVKSYSGESKSDVENQHHTHHKRLDHRLPGTTKGKQRKRGEPHPANLALWNFAEYMREFLLMVIDYNQEDVPQLAPTAMLKEGVKPTRINILKWMMAKNMRADIPCDVEHLRAFTLPTKDAVMTKTGIRLLMPDGIRHVPNIRFYSEKLKTSPAFAKAAKGGSPIRIKIKRREVDCGQIWFSLREGLRPIPNVSSDAEFVREATWTDQLEKVASDDLESDKAKQATQQPDLDKAIRREAISDRAKKQEKEELSDHPKKPSKTKTRSDLRKNRDEEMAALKSTASDPPPNSDESGAKASPSGFSQAASDAMKRFMEERP